MDSRADIHGVMIPGAVNTGAVRPRVSQVGSEYVPEGHPVTLNNNTRYQRAEQLPDSMTTREVSNPQRFRIGYLGPEGTFSQQAAKIYAQGFANAELIAFLSIEDMLVSVDSGRIEAAVAPMENSTEGPVNVTIDTLLFDVKLSIHKQMSLTISQCLMVGAKIDDTTSARDKIERVYGHSQTLAQCRKYLRERFPFAERRPVASNAEGARLASGDALSIAVGSKLAAETYGLYVMAENIQDESDNETIFAALMKTEPPAIVRNGKITITFSTQNRPGELYGVLGIFAMWEINITKIISRPIKGKPGQYMFYVELEDYGESDARDALAMIRRKTSEYKYLGSYPK
ncbi:MAG: prephenate dehydratase [Clostridiales bacterium]|jgi:prephenate dehydratase|nr:prephenate dehydratase [Clostridiales bacterium]